MLADDFPEYFVELVLADAPIAVFVYYSQELLDVGIRNGSLGVHAFEGVHDDDLDFGKVQYAVVIGVVTRKNVFDGCSKLAVRRNDAHRQQMQKLYNRREFIGM